VPSPAYLNALPYWLDRRGTGRTRALAVHRARIGRRTGLRFPAVAGGAGLADDVGDGLEVVGPLLLRAWPQAHHIPAARRDEPGGVLLAQVIRVRLHVGRQRPEDGR
jgi:hypothetical protein